MVRPLRQRHRVMVIALTLALPAAFAFGIATRETIPAAPVTLPAGVAEVRAQRELWRRDDLWEKRAIRTRLLSSNLDARQLAVTLVAMDRIVRPDVLVYWVPGERNPQNALPDDSFFLGKFALAGTAPLSLPAEVTSQKGFLALYSLADQEIVAVSKPFSTP